MGYREILIVYFKEMYISISILDIFIIMWGYLRYDRETGRFLFKKAYPKKLRKIKYYVDKSGKTLLVLTKNFELSEVEITILYKHRWKIELFFMWLMQHLKKEVRTV